MSHARPAARQGVQFTTKSAAATSAIPNICAVKTAQDTRLLLRTRNSDTRTHQAFRIRDGILTTKQDYAFKNAA